MGCGGRNQRRGRFGLILEELRERVVAMMGFNGIGEDVFWLKGGAEMGELFGCSERVDGCRIEQKKEACGGLGLWQWSEHGFEWQRANGAD
ncbi:hypothetical protein M0R45_026508 [Rubus argutus]|uniref:Uncharacterized protein n=1 Tax=Rubus argutus TaxID=59490 RepID=A0AAW1WZJ6_RUBAR